MNERGEWWWNWGVGEERMWKSALDVALNDALEGRRVDVLLKQSA